MNLFYICAQCQDALHPVTRENGRSLAFGASGRLQVELHLHHACIEAWSRDFEVPLPPAAKVAGA
ncbi:MAG: hypothetical protein ABSG16_22545 [Candidatus Acidiferrum sp.]|jgi:hypothetical protein